MTGDVHLELEQNSEGQNEVDFNSFSPACLGQGSVQKFVYEWPFSNLLFGLMKCIMCRSR